MVFQRSLFTFLFAVIPECFYRESNLTLDSRFRGNDIRCSVFQSTRGISMKRIMSILGVVALGCMLMPDRADAREKGEFGRENGAHVERIDREIKAGKGGTLTLATDRGGITVDVWDRDVVRVVVLKKAEVFTEGEAKAIFEDFELQIDREGKDVRVRARSLSDRRMRSMKVTFALTVPSVYHVDLRTEGGSIKVGDLEGNVKARTAGGSIEVGHIRNGSVDIQTSGGGLTILGIQNGDGKARTSGGSIRVGRVSGNLDVSTSGGKISIEYAGGEVKAETAGGGITVGESGRDLLAKTAGGSIKVGKAGGEVDVSTAGGSIKIGPSTGKVRARTAGGSIKTEQSQAEVDAETSGGSIRVEGSGGPVKVPTAGGSIRVVGARGYIEAETAGGSIDAELVVSDRDIDTHCRLETAGGDITLRLPGDLAATVDARLEISKRAKEDYRIYSGFPLTIEGQGTDRITAHGEINGGGDPISLSTRDGDIRIQKLEK